MTPFGRKRGLSLALSLNILLIFSTAFQKQSWLYPNSHHASISRQRLLLLFSNAANEEDLVASGTKIDVNQTTTSGPSAVRSQKPFPTDSNELQMISFYKFEPISDPSGCRDSLFESLKEIPGLRGTIYLAHEGINAQMAIPLDSLDMFMQLVSTNLPFDPFIDDDRDNTLNLGDVVSISTPTFDRLVVRTRDYVLRDGIGQDLDWSDAGPELDAQEWHSDLMSISSDSSSTSSLILDCRNMYESEEGTFVGATPLQTNTFQESWSKLDHMTKDHPKEKPLYIFCTGGIRCVKVGAYLKQQLGFDNVKRLKHGIIGYQQWLADNKNNNEMNGSVWEGENFLFDKRRFEEKEPQEDNR